VRAIVDRIWAREDKVFRVAIRDAHAQGLIEAPGPEAKAKALLPVIMGRWPRPEVKIDRRNCFAISKEVARDVLGVKHEHAASS